MPSARRAGGGGQGSDVAELERATRSNLQNRDLHGNTR